MLAFAEDFLASVRSARRDSDVIALLGQLAQKLGYRSGYMIEYGPTLHAARMVLDSNHQRRGWWEQYIASGLRKTTQPLADLLAKGGVHYVDGGRFAHPSDPLLVFTRKVDILNAALVPIKCDNEVMGLLGLCGERIMTTEEEHALKLIAYCLFSQARTVSVTGIRVATATLTPREREVIALAAEGLTASEVADRLGMSARTVNQHIDNVADKLNTKNRVHTVAEAIRQDLLGGIRWND